MRWTGWKVIAVVALYISLDSTRGILTKLSKGEGDYAYNPVSVTLTSTFVKLITSAAALYYESGVPKREELLDGDTHKYAVPGLVYLIDDNIRFITLSYLTPGEEALYMNAKVLTTAAALRVIMARPISPLQWSALCMLSLGLVSSRDSKNLHKLNPGHFLVLLVCAVGSFGDVYNEKLLKHNDASIHLQNAKLYFFGLILNGIAWGVYESHSTTSTFLFHDWNGYVVTLMLVTAAIGLNVSAIFRYLDNLVKVQASSASMITTVILSSLIFDKELTLHFYLAVGIVCNSLFIYNHKPTAAKETSEELLSQRRQEEEEGEEEAT